MGDRATWCALLRAVAELATAETTLALDHVLGELGVSEAEGRTEMELLEAAGLCLLGDAKHPSPLLMHAGEQYLARQGEVPNDVVRYLPSWIDDLHAREAMLTASDLLIDELREAFAVGDGVEYVRAWIPAAFVPAIDQREALRLYTAAAAIVVRLATGRAAACVAEEVMAAVLIEHAEAHLELLHDNGTLSADDLKHAVSELRGVFELFQDDDVLRLFEMREPSDAALDQHDEITYQIGVVDQRYEAWFDAFGGEIATGHLRTRRGLG